MSQSQTCEWIHILTQVLGISLKKLGHIPERDAQKVKELLESYMDKSSECCDVKSEEENFAIDGTERRRQRPKDQQEQKRFYSGKKKAHTVKNNVIVTL